MRSSRTAGASNKRSGTKPKAAPRKRRKSSRGIAFAVVAVILVLAFGSYRFFTGTGLNKKTTRNVESESKPVAEAPSLDRVVGRWSRSDTSARLEIRGVRDNGLLDALYYNPHAVHIETAAAKQERNYVRVYVKLQDPSDPGSTYRLNYDPQLDSMRGDYYDAVARQMSDVTFTRSK